MPKIETPEKFAQTIKDNAFDPRCWIPSEEVPTGYFDIKEAAQIIATRDAAIRAESAALLKMCRGALEATQIMMRFPIRERTFEITTPTMHAIDIALAALREAGVI